VAFRSTSRRAGQREQGMEGLAGALHPGRQGVFPARVVAGVKASRARCLLARIRQHDQHAPHPLAA